MRGEKSFAPSRTTRSSAIHNSTAPLVIHNDSSPMISGVPSELDYSILCNPLLSENSSPPLNPPISEPNQESVPISHSNSPTQPIYNISTITRPFIEIRNNKFEPLDPASGILKHIIHSHYDGAYTCFSEVSSDTKELWWREFQKKVQWDKGCCSDDLVLKAFKHSASSHIISMTSKARTAGVRPLWMAEGFWKDLMKRWKECPKFLGRSKINKRSREVATDLGIPPYAGGSIPVTAHKRKLRDELKREPTPKETFLKCYTKKDGTCVGKKAEEAVETFDKLYEKAVDLADTTEGSPPVDLNCLWIDAVGGIKKGKRVLGLGSEARSMLQMMQYSQNSKPLSLQDNGENMQHEMRESIQEVREEITQNNQRWEKIFEQLIAGQNTLAEKINSLGKKKGPRGI